MADIQFSWININHDIFNTTHIYKSTIIFWIKDMSDTSVNGVKGQTLISSTSQIHEVKFWISPWMSNVHQTYSPGTLWHTLWSPLNDWHIADKVLNSWSVNCWLVDWLVSINQSINKVQNIRTAYKRKLIESKISWSTPTLIFYLKRMNSSLTSYTCIEIHQEKNRNVD